MEVAVTSADNSPTHFESECTSDFGGLDLIGVPNAGNGDSKPFKCNECGFAFSRKNHLDRHTVVHTGQRPFKCQTCGGTFSRRSHLKRHALLHNEQNQFTCADCGAAFMLKELLMSHAAVHLGRKNSDTLPGQANVNVDIDLKFLEGKVVAATADEKVSAAASEHSFNGVAEFVEKMFNSMQVDHSLQEDCDRALSMPVADECSNELGQYDDSSNTYNDEQGTFTPQSSTSRSGGTLPSERRFKCEECGFPFARKKDLHRHMLIHTGIKPFACDKCEATFSRKYHLTRHINQHHGIFPCAKCGISFMDREQLSTHICLNKDNILSACAGSVASTSSASVQNGDDGGLAEEEIPTAPNKNESAHTFICLECGDAFSLLSELQCHAVTHSEQSHSTPERCSSEYASGSHEDSNDPIPSGDEGTGASSSQQPLPLKLCGNFVSGERPFKCDDCGVSFYRRKDLRRHAFIHTGRRPFSCVECGMSFTRNHHLKRHILTHRGSRPYSCKDCGATFTRSYHLHRHTLTHTGGIPSVTNNGNAAVGETSEDANSTFFQHNSVATSEKPFPCLECGFPFARKKDLRRHSLIHTGQRPFTCDTCAMTFSRKSHLKRHAANIHGIILGFTCDHCGTTFDKKEQMCTHICDRVEQIPVKYDPDEASSDGLELPNGLASLLVETSITTPDENMTDDKSAAVSKTFKCGDCGSTFAERLHWEQHCETKCELVNTHIKQEMDDALVENGINKENDEYIKPESMCRNGFRCGECGAEFFEKLDFQTHLLTHGQSDSVDEGSMLQCTPDILERDDMLVDSDGKLLPFVGEVAISPQTNVPGRNHLPTLRLFKCEQCGHTFRFNRDLKRHELTHTGHKPHACGECGATFSRSHHLQRHSLIHSGTRPYTCDVCKATFTRSYHLQRHALIHVAGAKLFTCKDCPAMFAREDDLQVHSQTHVVNSSEVKESPCVSVVTKQTLRCHTRTKKYKKRSNGEKPYKCDVCGASFSWKQTLQQHAVVHTGGKPYQCSECGAQFALRQHFMAHTRTHNASRTKPSEKRGQTVHTRKPKKEKRYKCGACDASFAYRLSLTNHTRLHTGEKPFTCETCGEAFGQNRHLQYHRREVHKAEISLS